MKTYDVTVNVTYHLRDIEAEDEQQAEEYGYYHFDEYSYFADVEQVEVFETGDDND